MQEEFTRLKLEGRLEGPYVGELDRAWRSLASSLGSKNLLVDLCGVLYVDAAGKRLLVEIHSKSGAEFFGNSALTKYLAEEAMHRNHANGEQGG